jgi:hypothetical protein
VIAPFIRAGSHHISRAMEHSLITAGRTTHLKIVLVALVGATVVVAAGIAGHVSAGDTSARLPAVGQVIKAGKPVTYTSQDRSMLR